MKRTLLLAVIGGALLCTAARVDADATVKVDPSANWIGFMNVLNLPADGGAYQFGSSWGTADLVAFFSGPVLTLAPNTIGDPDPYWYIGGGGPGAPGNKIMDANMYVEPPAGTYAGQTVTFQGNVLTNTLVDPYTSVAFIKEFVADYSSFVQVTVPLTPGAFSISLAANADPAHHVQYGFETIGPNVWITDVGPKGSVEIAAVPEPATVLLAAIGVAGLVGLARRRRMAA
jgi:hypothetical protein